MTLIEVLVALLILFISLLGGAGMQLNALKHTSSALVGTQDSFAAYSKLEQIRANSRGDYQILQLDPISHSAGDKSATAS